ncbi:MAG: MbcA/ParS/Xre antitoxin family protein [Pseudomonadota bacterium]
MKSDTDRVDTEMQANALKQITLAVVNLLDSWRLQTAEMQQLLALPSNVRTRMFNKYRDGNAFLPNDPLVLRRAMYLLRINDALRTTYPCNPKMSERWIRQPQRRFGRRTPLSMIQEQGEDGLIMVLCELDCTFSWDLTSSKPKS